MKKRVKAIICCLLILAAGSAAGWTLWEAGAIIFDRPDVACVEYVSWHGKAYYPISGAYTEGRMISLGQGSCRIRMVKEDPSHTFIVARSFLENSLLVAADYAVPTSGELTAVSWHGTYIDDPSFLEAVSKIDAEKCTSFTYETEGIYQLTDNQHMKELYFAYDHCPVATNNKGYMGKINGEWVITRDVPVESRNWDGTLKKQAVDCYVIPDAYWDILSKYFQ